MAMYEREDGPERAPTRDGEAASAALVPEHTRQTRDGWTGRHGGCRRAGHGAPTGAPSSSRTSAEGRRQAAGATPPAPACGSARTDPANGRTCPAPSRGHGRADCRPSVASGQAGRVTREEQTRPRCQGRAGQASPALRVGACSPSGQLGARPLRGGGVTLQVPRDAHSRSCAALVTSLHLCCRCATSL